MVIMINNDHAHGLMNEITHSIADVYGFPGFTPITKQIMHMDPSAYKQFTGVFQHENYTIEIVLVDDKLFSKDKNMTVELHPEKERTFFIKEFGGDVEFFGTEDVIDGFTTGEGKYKREYRRLKQSPTLLS